MKLRKKDIFSFIVLISYFSFLFYLNWILGPVEEFVSLSILILIFWWFYIIIKKIFWSKNILSPEIFISRFVFIYSLIIFLIFSIVWSFSYYYNEKNPSYMKEYTLKNWEKTVVFQEMTHIWWKNFYENITKNLQNFREKNFVHFYEWVKPWSEENSKEFNKAMWFEFDESLYPNIAKIFGLESQDYLKIMWTVTEKDINIDINLDEVMEEYKKLEKENPSKKIENPEIVNISKEVENFSKNTTNREKYIIAYIWKAFLNFTFSNIENMKTIQWWNDNLMKAILDKRDVNLAENIISSEHKEIYITYGALHFPWVFKYLQEKDKNWKIEKIEKIKAL